MHAQTLPGVVDHIITIRCCAAAVRSVRFIIGAEEEEEEE